MTEPNTTADAAAPNSASGLSRTPLYGLHTGLGARMVPFAGYEMPVQYDGILAEHLHTRASAGLFDVSHMGQAFLVGPDHETTAKALEALIPSDILGLGLGRMRYSLLLNPQGRIIDDLIVTRSGAPEDDGRLFLVVNAGRKHVDYSYIADALPAGVELRPLNERALVALQGPKAAEILAKHAPKAANLTFMTACSAEFDGMNCHISRSGYTGEDGFEISITADKVTGLVETLLAHDAVKPVGLGARDTLRLEAGLCLYGHDIDETTDPVEADLTFTLSKRRREAADFPGAQEILRIREHGPARKRVGLRLDGRAPAREGSEILDSQGIPIGTVTSGGFGPSVGAPIAMGYVTTGHAAIGSQLACSVRNKALAATVSAMPFVPHAYFR